MFFQFFWTTFIIAIFSKNASIFIKFFCIIPNLFMSSGARTKFTQAQSSPVLKALAAFSKVAGPGRRPGRARRRETPQLPDLTNRIGQNRKP